MHVTSTITLALLLGLAACGGDDDAGNDKEDAANEQSDTRAGGDDAESDAGSGDAGGAGGDVVDPQPAGQAKVSVDGREFTLTEPGAIGCMLADDSITFSFRIGDNEFTLGGGANRTDDEWFGGIDVRIANPEGEDGPITYFPELPANSNALAIDGNSFSYSGPMQKQPPNDGSNPPPVDVGEGLVTLTCP